MRRRDFLTTGLCVSLTTVTGQAWSAPATDQRLLLVFLRGGYDALNIIVPTYSDFYYQARPRISIARPDEANPNAALPLDADWSLHPALRETIHPLWKKKQIAFIPFAGTDDTSRSHFETQDTIELGQPVGGSRNYRSGFMARLAEQISGARPIAFTSQPPLTLQGPSPAPNVAITSMVKPAIDERQAQLIQDMYRGHDLQAAISEGFSVRDKAFSSASPAAREMVAANRDAPLPTGFELAARRVARMMSADYNLAFLDVGGWDTHVSQGGATGVLSDRIGMLGRGLAGLADEMGPETWNKTTVVVISEFGRTFRENGDRGTDHGRGSIYWVLGGGVNGGRMVGNQTKLTPASLNEGRDLPVLIDYRALLGGIFSQLYGLNATNIDRVFPTVSPAKLSLL